MKDDGPLRGQCCSPGFGVRFVRTLGRDQTGLTHWAEHWLVFTSSGKWLFCQLIFIAHVFCVLCYIPGYLNTFIVHVLYVLCYIPDHWCRSYREAGSREYQNWILNQKFSSGMSLFPIPKAFGLEHLFKECLTLCVPMTRSSKDWTGMRYGVFPHNLDLFQHGS